MICGQDRASGCRPVIELDRWAERMQGFVCPAQECGLQARQGQFEIIPSQARWIPLILSEPPEEKLRAQVRSQLVWG